MRVAGEEWHASAHGCKRVAGLPGRKEACSMHWCQAPLERGCKVGCKAFALHHGCPFCSPQAPALLPTIFHQPN